MRIRNVLGAFLLSAAGTYALAAPTQAQAASVRMHGSSCYLEAGSLFGAGTWGMWSSSFDTVLICPFNESSSLGHANVTSVKVYGHRENSGDTYFTTFKTCRTYSTSDGGSCGDSVSVSEGEYSNSVPLNGWSSSSGFAYVVGNLDYNDSLRGIYADNL